ncbi:alpha/beta hydrolase [Rhodocista pekingensis]|uniref:Alpha/beta hydrolase n=1 Tax=Rhodocista pekingensis TaxID=201185 RepID=A0ABW2L1S4_9PROT
MATSLHPSSSHRPATFVAPDLPEPVARVVRLVADSPPPASDLTAVRRHFSALRRSLGPEPPDLASVRDEEIRGPGGPLRLRLYRPSFTWKPQPALLYLHGGGWTFGDLESHDTLCRQLARATGHTIVAVDYRLAPEHPFPAPLEDAWAALSWLVENARLLAIDPLAIGVAGDSAGGNLAAVLALKARDAGSPHLKCQVLIYPCLDLVAYHPSHRLRETGYLLTRAQYLWYVGNYLGQGTSALDWRVSPLRAQDLSGLPPTVLVTAGFDPLLDEGRAFAGRLAETGVPVLHSCHRDMVHGFITMGGALAAANQAIAEIARGLASFDIYGLTDGAGI